MIIKIREVADWTILSTTLPINLIFNIQNHCPGVYYFDRPLDILQKVNKFRTFAFCKFKFPLL